MATRHDTRDDLLNRIEALTTLKTSLELAHDAEPSDSLGLAIDALGDELGPLEDELFEIEETLGFEEARQDNREKQPR